MKQLVVLAASLLLVWSSSSTVFAETAARANELDCRYLFQIENNFFLSQHVIYSQRDKALQDRVVEQFLKKLDPSKIYLLQSDVDGIRKKLSNLFDNVKKRDCSSLEESEKIVLTRSKERAEFAKKILGKDYKFDKTVEFV